jgi:hypothetical protein
MTLGRVDTPRIENDSHATPRASYTVRLASGHKTVATSDYASFEDARKCYDRLKATMRTKGVEFRRGPAYIMCDSVELIHEERIVSLERAPRLHEDVGSRFLVRATER